MRYDLIFDLKNEAFSRICGNEPKRNPVAWVVKKVADAQAAGFSLVPPAEFQDVYDGHLENLSKMTEKHKEDLMIRLMHSALIGFNKESQGSSHLTCSYMDEILRNKCYELLELERYLVRLKRLAKYGRPQGRYLEGRFDWVRPYGVELCGDNLTFDLFGSYYWSDKGLQLEPFKIALEFVDLLNTRLDEVDIAYQGFAQFYGPLGLVSSCLKTGGNDELSPDYRHTECILEWRKAQKDIEKFLEIWSDMGGCIQKSGTFSAPELLIQDLLCRTAVSAVDARESEIKESVLFLSVLAGRHLKGVGLRIDAPYYLAHSKSKRAIFTGAADTLLQALWLSIWESFASGDSIGKCDNCGKWFHGKGRGKSGSYRRFCSPKCRGRRFEAVNPGRKKRR